MNDFVDPSGSELVERVGAVAMPVVATPTAENSACTTDSEGSLATEIVGSTRCGEGNMVLDVARADILGAWLYLSRFVVVLNTTSRPR